MCVNTSYLILRNLCWRMFYVYWDNAIFSLYATCTGRRKWRLTFPECVKECLQESFYEVIKGFPTSWSIEAFHSSNWRTENYHEKYRTTKEMLILKRKHCILNRRDVFAKCAPETTRWFYSINVKVCDGESSQYWEGIVSGADILLTHRLKKLFARSEEEANWIKASTHGAFS